VRADIHISEELSFFLHRLPGNDRLGHVWPLWRGQSRPARPASGVCRLNPQVQVQGAVDQVNPFLVPWVPLHVAQEPQSEAPRHARVVEADQQVSD
jgi:hypothetical protein